MQLCVAYNYVIFTVGLTDLPAAQATCVKPVWCDK